MGPTVLDSTEGPDLAPITFDQSSLRSDKVRLDANFVYLVLSGLVKVTPRGAPHNICRSFGLRINTPRQLAFLFRPCQGPFPFSSGWTRFHQHRRQRYSYLGHNEFVGKHLGEPSRESAAPLSPGWSTLPGVHPIQPTLASAHGELRGCQLASSYIP